MFQFQNLKEETQKVFIKNLENLLEPTVLEIKTDLKALIPIVNVNPEPNSFLIKIEQIVNYIEGLIGFVIIENLTVN